MFTTRKGNSTFAALNTPSILNYTIQVGNTWESVGAIPSRVQAWRLRTRDASSFDYAYSAAPAAHMTASSGVIEASTMPSAIYVRTTQAGKILELETWS